MKWGQGWPYNQYCDRLCPVGCVAVALGQIITTEYYTRTRTMGTTNFQKVIHGHDIDWNTIFKTIDGYINNSGCDRYFVMSAGKTTPETEAVARLLYGIAEEVDMVYGADASTSTIGKAEKFLNDIGFGGVGKWKYQSSLVYKMIVERNHPVYVRGADRDNEGHAWVIDGIMSQNQKVESVERYTNKVVSSRTENRQLFHCNFGWTGKCDGYYYIHAFQNPDSTPELTETDFSKNEREKDGPKANYTHDMKILTFTEW